MTAMITVNGRSVSGATNAQDAPMIARLAPASP